MPSPETVDKAVAAIRLRADAYEYFFGHLTSPGWIAPLAERGFFAAPPEPLVEGEYVQFPVWQESRYLVRVAGAAPGEVLTIIERLPATRNPRVHEDVLDALLAMDPALGLSLLPQISQWLDSPYQLLLSDKAADFAARLAQSAHTEAAVSLGLRLLQVVGVERPAVSGVPLPPNVRGKLDDWHYERALEKIAGSVAPVAPMALLRMLITLLRSAVEAASSPDSAPRDGSFVWRPSIEDTDQNWDHDFRGILVRALRDAALATARMDSVSRDLVLEALGLAEWRVFERIALHLIRMLGDDALAVARERLLRVESGDDPGLFHEYWLLARDTFPKLTPEEQLQILSATNNPQDGAGVADEPVDHEVRQQRQYVRLAILTREALPPEWQDRYDQLSAVRSLPEHPSFLVAHGDVRTGPNSPLTPDELLALSDEHLLDFLTTWQPGGEWMGPSSEGLGRALGRAVTQDPARFAELAPRLRGYDPTYVRGLFGGFRDAAKGTVSFDWEGALTLAVWAVQQEPSERGEATDFERDQGWSTARQEVAWMLSAGLEPGQQTVPYVLRANVWEALEPLTNDSNPTQEFEIRYGGTNMDPLSLSLNTVRGAAFHALLAFALWVRRHMEDAPGSEARMARGFDEMPEVRRVLEEHLDPQLDPSHAIRSVYGQEFPFLVLIDPTWARDHVAPIFPNPQAEVELWRSAWLGYLNSPNIYSNVVEILIDEYATAVARVFDGAEESTPESAQLSHHLVAMYWQSLIGLETPVGLLPEFWKRATAKERSEALTFVGLTLSRIPHASEGIINRLIALWESRTAELAASSEAEAAEELPAFGWWFASGKFPTDWALQQLMSVLQRTGKAETNHLVLEHVAELASQSPLVCVELLSLLLKPTNDPWGIWAQNEATPRAIEAAINSTDSAAEQASVDLIHWLGVRGHQEFQRLLPQSTRPNESV